MEKKLSSILDEILDVRPQRDRDLFVESQAQQVIASATHLLRLIRESYSQDDADDLAKRLIRSIATGDEKKFRRRIQAIRESNLKDAAE